MYLMTEIQKVYRSQGQNIHDKHFEVIIRKMMSKVQVTRPGDTQYLPGDPVDRLEIRKINEQLVAEGKQPARYVGNPAGCDQGFAEHRLVPLGLLLPAHHQGAGGRGDRIRPNDPLFGLKENVIIGKLIPAGTGFIHGRFDEVQPEPVEAPAEVVSNLPTAGGE